MNFIYPKIWELKQKFQSYCCYYSCCYLTVRYLGYRIHNVWHGIMEGQFYFFKIIVIGRSSTRNNVRMIVTFLWVELQEWMDNAAFESSCVKDMHVSLLTQLNIKFCIGVIRKCVEHRWKYSLLFVLLTHSLLLILFWFVIITM